MRLIQFVKFLLMLITCLSYIPTMSQTTGHSAIKGKIMGQDRKSIPYAQIFIKSLNIGTVSGTSGEYILERVPEGVYKLSVSYLGYSTQSRTIEIDRGKTYELDFMLTQDSRGLDEIIIKGKTNVQKVEETGFNVNAIETKQFQNTTLDINQIIGQKAGVRIRETGGLGSNFNFFLNGLSGRQVKFFLDGQPLENVGAVFNLNNIPSNLIERVDIYKGAVPIQLGADALVGAINLVTKQDFRNFLDVSYSYGSFNTHRGNVSAKWRNPESGLTLGVRSFYNYSDNNYTMRNVETVSEGQFITGDFERFHDSFESYLGNLEMGFTNVAWADRFMLGIVYGSLDKDVQTSSRGSLTSDGALSLPSYGQAVQEEESARYTLRHNKNDLGVKGLDADIFLSYNTLRSTNIDTTSNRYNWEGRIISSGGISGELNFDKTLFVFEQDMFLGNVGLTYDLNETHQLCTNFTWSYLERTGENTFLADEEDPFREPNTLDKKVLGLAYRWKAFDEKLETTFSGKYFDLGILARESRHFASGELSVADLVTKESFFGYGMASRYFINEQLKVKASYERAYRLPEAFEIFGDGLLVLASPNIVPESSHNVNLGGTWQKRLGNERDLRLEANGFLRVVDNVIFPTQGGIFVSYDNIQNILIKGIEGELRYKGSKGFEAGLNVTYQDVLNNVEFLPGTSQ